MLTGCSLPRTDPEVTFYANGKTIRIEPTVYCEIDGTKCAQRELPAKLKVPAGKVVQISVDGEIADSLWRVVFLYENGAKVQDVLTSRVLGKGEDYTYTLALPNRDDQLVQIEVQQAAAAVYETGEAATRGTWAVEVTR